MIVICRAILLLLLLTSADYTAAKVPTLLNYSGSLEGLEGAATLTFTLSGSETGGIPLWQETHEVTVQAGRFSLLLGSQSAISVTLLKTQPLYLGVSVGDSELSPRQQVVSVAYALRSEHASDVAEENISPASIALSGGGASIDSTGALQATLLAADSLVIGGTPVIDSSGAWIGTGSTQTALSLQSVVTKTVSEADIFFFNSRWVVLEQFDTFVDLAEPGKLDVSFVAQISSRNPFETRITIKQVSPDNLFLGQFGNTSGAQSSPDAQGSTVYNQAMIDLVAGTYRILIEHQSSSVVVATLQSGSLIGRVYY